MRLGRSASRCRSAVSTPRSANNLEKASPMASCPKSTGKGHRGPQAGQSTGHIRWRSSQTVVHRPIHRRITSRRPKPIDQGFTETNDNGTKRHPTASEPSLRVGRAFQPAKQRLNDPSIGGRKGVIPQVLRPHPTQPADWQGAAAPPRPSRRDAPRSAASCGCRRDQR